MPERDLHLVYTDDGGAQLVETRPGPYSHSEPTDVVLITLTADELAHVLADVAAKD